jgi:hypothetical protein
MAANEVMALIQRTLDLDSERYRQLSGARFRHLPRRFAERMRILSEKDWFPECVWRVNCVSLMRSVPGPDGAEYACLSNFSPEIDADGS